MKKKKRKDPLYSISKPNDFPVEFIKKFIEDVKAGLCSV